MRKNPILWIEDPNSDSTGREFREGYYDLVWDDDKTDPDLLAQFSLAEIETALKVAEMRSERDAR